MTAGDGSQAAVTSPIMPVIEPCSLLKPSFGEGRGQLASGSPQWGAGARSPHNPQHVGAGPRSPHAVTKMHLLIYFFANSHVVYAHLSCFECKLDIIAKAAENNICTVNRQTVLLINR